MKTTTFMAVMAIVFLLSCQKTQRNISEKPTLNLTAPSGQPIAASTGQLKEITVAMLAEKFGIREDVAITGIAYLPVTKGYAATIQFQLANGQTGSYAVLTENHIKALTPALSIVSPKNGQQLQSRTYMLVCEGSCQCRAYIAFNGNNGTISWNCGCNACDGSITTY